MGDTDGRGLIVHIHGRCAKTHEDPEADGSAVKFLESVSILWMPHGRFCCINHILTSNTRSLKHIHIPNQLIYTHNIYE